MIKREITFLPDEGKNGKVLVKKTQDVEPFIENAKRLSEYWNSGSRRDHEMYLLGEIPQIIVEDYCTKNGVSFYEFIQDDKHVKRILNDPDFSKFRIWKGRF